MRITDTLKIQSYYEALVSRNQQFVGTFFVGVKTTSIFCIPTCRARKPKFKNVEFYSTVKSAMDNGYRPCKVCKPTENAHKAPPAIERAIQLVKEQPKTKITDQQLQALDLSPVTIRRWFKKHYGMTFQAYQRMYRINSAYQELQQGKNATHTAFDSGYESLSGFGYTFKKLTGQSPAHHTEQSLILINRVTTPLGPMFICATEKGICLLEFTDRRMLETEFKDLQKRLNAPILAGENQHIKQAKKELKAYFKGELKNFTVALDTPGTEFQNLVWNSLKTIPYGHTRSYQQQAVSLGKPKAIRAVANANGMNRVAIIIPCHRVIGKNGHLTGYAGGLERKQWLLNHEKELLKTDM